MTEWRFLSSFSHLVIKSFSHFEKKIPKIIAIIGSHILLSRQRKLFSSAGKNILLGREKYSPRQGIILSSLMTFLFAIFFAKVVRNNI